MAATTKRTITIEINGKEVEDSLKGVGREVGRLKKALREATDPADRKRLNEELKVAKKRYGELKSEIEEVGEELKDAEEEAKNLLGAFNDIFTGFKTGNPLLIKQGFDQIKTGIRGATKAAVAFIATPLGATLTVLAGIGIAAKKWSDYNEEIRDAILLTNQLTGLQGEAADDVRLRAQALSDTFDSEFSENLQAAKVLVKEFEISYEQAFDIIEEGFINSGTKSDEFLDSIKEYPTFFARAGFSAQQFSDIVNTGIDLGIFNDKLPDAIKEFVLSIEEQTKATTDALINAFGETFTNDLLEDVKTGSITAQEALARVAKEAKEVGLNSQQAQVLTADLFRGAGEDAGGALKIFEAINTALSDQTDVLSPLQEQLKRTADANLELARAQDEALKSDSYITLSNNISLFWKRVKTLFFEGLNFVTDIIVESQIQAVTAFTAIFITIQQFPEIVRNTFKTVKENVFNLVKSFRGLGNVLDAIIRLDFKEAKEAYTEFSKDFSENLVKVAKSATGVIDEINNIRKSAEKTIRLKFERTAIGAREESAQNEGPTRENVGLTPEEIKAREEREKEAEKEREKRIKEEEREQERILESRRKLAEMLDQFELERKQKKEVEDLDELTQKQVEEEIALDEEFAKLEEQAEGRADLLERLEIEKEERFLEIIDRYAKIRADKREKENKKTTKQQKEFNKKLIAAQEELENAKLDAIAFGLSSLKSFVKEGSGLYKALFIAEQSFAAGEVLIKGFEERAKIAAAYAAIPGGQAISGPLILASRIRTGIALASIAAASIKGFKDGGPTGNDIIMNDPHGGITGVVHKNEYVIPEAMYLDPKYADTIGWLESERKSKLRGFVDGGPTNETETNEVATPATETTDQLTDAVNRLVAVLEEPILAQTFIGNREAKEINDLIIENEGSNLNGTLAG